MQKPWGRGRTKKAMVKEQEEEIATINFITLCRKPIEGKRERTTNNAIGYNVLH